MEEVREYIRERIVVEDHGFSTCCWIWKRALNLSGYGQGKPPCCKLGLIHRHSYRAHVGEIPAGFHLDHLCRVRDCCNPDHLEPVTPEENNRRARPFAPSTKLRTHCKRGHELTPENVYVASNGRRCRTCCNAWQREHGWPRRKKTGEPVKNPHSHCAKGHELTPENTIIWNNGRRCRACNIVWRAEKDDHRARHRMERMRKAVATRLEAGGDSQPSGDRNANRMSLTHSGSVT